MSSIAVIFPAFSSFKVFKNDLLVKVSGKSLIEHAYDKALRLTNGSNIFVITDLEDVHLHCERAGIKVSLLQLADFQFNIENLFRLINLEKISCDYVSLISPYAFFFELDVIVNSIKILEDGTYIKPLKQLGNSVYVGEAEGYKKLEKDNLFQDIPSFILSMNQNSSKLAVREINVITHDDISFDFNNRHDIWLYSKYLNRKKVVFNVAASKTIGMGHVYRCISLAHEIIEHEVVFVCDESSLLAVTKIAEHEYPIFTYRDNNIEEVLCRLLPDLVINDILNTTEHYVNSLVISGVKVLNFEDLGSGAIMSNVTINDLYDMPLYDSTNTLWGSEYFFIRDEFYSAKAHESTIDVETVLLTFGGTDQNDLTRKCYRAIKEYCKSKKIKILIVTGDGYSFLDALISDLKCVSKEEVEFVHHTGVMSRVMEKCQIAISSNGRTIYELAHMNIPTIVISHHDREGNHLFSVENNGFLNLGVYRSEIIETELLYVFKELFQNKALRTRLHGSMKRFNFVNNKQKVCKIINDLIN